MCQLASFWLVSSLVLAVPISLRSSYKTMSCTKHLPLHPAELSQRPRCVPYLDHALNLVVCVHREDVDIVGVGLLVRRWYRPTLSCVLGVVGGVEHRRAG